MSPIDICNIALSHVGGYRINALTDPTKEARECALHYAIARDATLADHDWDFARKRIALALLSTTYSGWDYAYQYPSDCLVARRIYDDTGLLDEDGGIEFEVAANDGLTGRVILTDQEDAELIYTAKVQDVNIFSPQFVEAHALRLASSLAQPLKGKPELRQSLLGLYGIQVNAAKGTDSKQGIKRETGSGSFVGSRS